MAGPKTIQKMKKYASGRGIYFVLSHLLNIGKTIEHGAIISSKVKSSEDYSHEVS